MRPTIKLAILCVLALMFGACAGRQTRVQTMPIPTKSGVMPADVAIAPSDIVTSLDLPTPADSPVPIEVEATVVSPVPVEVLASVKRTVSKAKRRSAARAPSEIVARRAADRQAALNLVRQPEPDHPVERQDMKDSLAAGPPAPSIYPPPRERPRDLAPAGIDRTKAPSASQTPPNRGRDGPSPNVLIAFLLVFIGALAAVALDLRGKIQENNRYNEMQASDSLADMPPMEPIPPVQSDPGLNASAAHPASPSDTYHPALARHVNGMLNNAPCKNQVAGTIGTPDPSPPKPNPAIVVQDHTAASARPISVPPRSTTLN